jgi:AAA+ ATPase superfamily predicted ATPase
MKEEYSPFKFGKVVHGERFSNRSKERNRLKTNFKSGLNTILISPRRWGKSSLIKEVASEYGPNSKTRFCFMDLMSIRTEEEFYTMFAKAVISATSSKMEEVMNNAKEFLINITPTISISPTPESNFDIGFNVEQMKMNFQDVLELPERIAKKKNINLIVCIDEFQSLANVQHSKALQGKLRSVWQHHQHATYCLYGSKRHLLLDIFNSRSMPFYKFGDVMFLEKISKEHLTAFVIKRFTDTKKKIGSEAAENLVTAMQCHPYYVQQLAHITWVNTKKTATNETLELAQELLLEQNDIFYQREFENMSDTQVGFVKALVNGETRFSSQKALKKYNLGSSSNVVQIKNALEKKEIIDLFQGKIELMDPGFELWFKKRICN